MLPSEYLALDRQEKAFLIASIDLKVDSEKEQEKELKRKTKRR